MKLVILGSGAIANTHAQAIKNTGVFELYGVCGNMVNEVEQFAERYGIRAFGTLQEVLALKDVVAVSVCTPSGLHAQQGIEIARAGKNVFMEKPIAISVQEAIKLVDTCRAHKVYMNTFFQRRLEYDIIRLKEILDTKLLGKVFHFSLQMNWYRSPEYYSAGGWRGTWAMDGGGALMNQAIHYIDMICHLFGTPESVFARSATCMHKIEVDDLTMGIFKFHNDTTGIFQFTTAAYPGFETRLEIFGTNGSVTVVNEKIMSLQIMNGESFTDPESKVGSVNNPSVGYENHAKLYEQFAKDLIDGAKVSNDAAWELVRANVVIEAVYEAARRRNNVQIEPIIF